MAISVQILSVDAASHEQRTITVVKTGTDTLSAYYETSSNPGDVKQADLIDVKADVKADVGAAKVSVTYDAFPLDITATGALTKTPPSVSADVGLLGKFNFPLQAEDYDKIIDFLRKANFPKLA